MRGVVNNNYCIRPGDVWRLVTAFSEVTRTVVEVGEVHVVYRDNKNDHDLICFVDSFRRWWKGNPTLISATDLEGRHENGELKPVPFTPNEYLLQNYIPVPEAGCWLWTGPWCDSGYGRVARHGKEITRAHRMFYTVHKGEIPKGLFVCHKCDTPACVNPDHLFLGTARDNVQDMIRKGRNRPGGRKPIRSYPLEKTA